MGTLPGVGVRLSDTSSLSPEGWVGIQQEWEEGAGVQAASAVRRVGLAGDLRLCLAVPVQGHSTGGGNSSEPVTAAVVSWCSDLTHCLRCTTLRALAKHLQSKP